MKTKRINSAKDRARTNKWHVDNRVYFKEYRRAHHLKTKYGLTSEAFSAMLAGQNGRCAICGTNNFSAGPGRCPVIDHDHETGKIRGILCFGCNVGIGAFKENISLIRAVVDYLDKSGGGA